MTKEQKKAIEKLENLKNAKILYGNTSGVTIEGFKSLQQDLETVLNMLKEKDKELKMYKDIKEIVNYKVTDLAKLKKLNEMQKEIEKKDKMIDLMAEFIEKVTVDLKVAFGENMLWNQNEIKQYFERIAEKSSSIIKYKKKIRKFGGIMREIKFRGFTINEEKFDNGKDGWIYGNLSILDDGKVDIQDINDENWFKAVNPESVGQYTGLKDKNGKEIYEGDIVKSYFENGLGAENKCLIIFDEYLCAFMGQEIKTKQQYLFNEGNPNKKDKQLKYTEVISNIYDNPELLGGKDGRN